MELAPLRSPPGPLSILLFLVSLPHPHPLHLPSAPPHSLFISAWIAPFHYTHLPAHYQSHNCFNNRSPPPPALSFPWQPTMRSERERGENSRGRKKREWEGGSAFPWPLLPFRRETFTTTVWVWVRLNWPIKRAALLKHHARCAWKLEDKRTDSANLIFKYFFVKMSNKVLYRRKTGGKKGNKRGRIV